jgi:hypothetical protein
MPPRPNCLINAQRPFDPTCRAAFEVDDPVDDIGGLFSWPVDPFGKGLFEMRRSLEAGTGSFAFAGSPAGPVPKRPQGSSSH